MKVIAKIEEKKYVCVVEHYELEKFINLYYNNLKELKVGDSIDLGTGYNHHRDTKEALKQTQQFFEANIKTIEAITNAFTKGIINEN